MSDVDWESRYQNADTPWDKGECHPALADLIDHFLNSEGAIIVPGCGRGWDLLALAKAYPTRIIIGVDLSLSAVVAARELCVDFPHVQVHHADFFDTISWLGNYEVSGIWEHTCFCAIPPELRDDYAKTVNQILPSGGILAGVFFTDMDDERSGPPWNCPVDEVIQRFESAFTIEFGDGSHPTFPSRQGEERLIVMTKRGNLA
jgi:methyl halide transferase